MILSEFNEEFQVGNLGLDLGCGQDTVDLLRSCRRDKRIHAHHACLECGEDSHTVPLVIVESVNASQEQLDSQEGEGTEPAKYPPQNLRAIGAAVVLCH